MPCHRTNGAFIGSTEKLELALIKIPKPSVQMPYLLILIVAASRFLPHPPNFACVGALGLFAGCYIAGKKAYLIPLGALLLSDLVGQAFGIAGMGFYNIVSMIGVYVGMMAAVPLGRMLQKRKNNWMIPVGALGASTAFFLLSNLGVWLGPWYPNTIAGLTACFTSAVPFFGYTIAGDLVFAGAMFGAWEWSLRTGNSRNLQRAFN